MAKNIAQLMVDTLVHAGIARSIGLEFILPLLPAALSRSKALERHSAKASFAPSAASSAA
jgi:hypothetical protein